MTDIFKLIEARRARQHEELKQEIKMMQENLNYLRITQAPGYLIRKAEQRLTKLQHKLNQGRFIYEK